MSLIAMVPILVCVHVNLPASNNELIFEPAILKIMIVSFRDLKQIFHTSIESLLVKKIPQIRLM